MTFNLDHALMNCYCDYHLGVIHHSDEATKNREAAWKKVTRIIKQWQVILFDPDFMTAQGQEDLHRRKIYPIGNHHPASEMHYIASILHQNTVLKYSLDNSDWNEVFDQVISSPFLNGRENRMARKQLRILSNNIPLLQRLSEVFLRNVPLQPERYQPVHADFEISPDFVDGIVQDLNEVYDEAAHAIGDAGRRFLRFLSS